MILSSRIFGSIQLKEKESQITEYSLKESCISITNNVMHLYPEVFIVDNSGLLQRIDVDIQSSINISIDNNNKTGIPDVCDVQIKEPDEIEVLETYSVGRPTRKPKKNIFRRFARWFRKRSSTLKCF